jgi:hypothetical protein
MIKIDREYEVAVWLRQKVIDMIAGVEDARGIWWDHNSPNWMTERAIEKMSVALAERLQSLGAIRVYEHAPCGSGQHEEQAKFSVISMTSYWRLVLEDGRSDAHTVKKGRLFVDGLSMDHSEPDMSGKVIPCPCRPERTVDHSVTRYHAWPHGEDTRLGMFCECLSILGEAKSRSGPRKRRSAVREQLLKCVILLNDEIAPVSAHEHIATRSTG